MAVVLVPSICTISVTGVEPPGTSSASGIGTTKVEATMSIADSE